jgi:predicted ATPase
MLGRVKWLEVEGYRSVQGLEINLSDINLITGANGCGKSNLFNAFKLIKSAAEGRLSYALAHEGGFERVLWGGRQKDDSVKLRLAMAVDEFDLDLGLGHRPPSEFPLFRDPQVKHERIRLAQRVLVDRKSSVAHCRDIDDRKAMRSNLVDSESILGQIQEPDRYPMLYHLREMISRWTFYHDFRTDAESTLRRPSVPTYAARLNDEGSNLGPTLFVIANQGEHEKMVSILANVFPSARFVFSEDRVTMHDRNLGRSFEQNEFSDGTLKFLALTAACFAKKPPALIAFNEPENSLSPSAIEPLADLFAHASQYSQLWITTHSQELVQALKARSDCRPIELEKVDGETTLRGKSMKKGWWSDES